MAAKKNEFKVTDVLSKRTLKAWADAGYMKDSITCSNKYCITINGWYRINLNATQDKVLKMLTGGQYFDQFRPNIYISPEEIEALRLTMKDVKKYRDKYCFDDGRLYLPNKYIDFYWDLGRHVYFPDIMPLKKDVVGHVYCEHDKKHLTEQVEYLLKKHHQRMNVWNKTDIEHWQHLLKNIANLQKEGYLDEIKLPEMPKEK